MNDHRANRTVGRHWTARGAGGHQPGQQPGHQAGGHHPGSPGHAAQDSEQVRWPDTRTCPQCRAPRVTVTAIDVDADTLVKALHCSACEHTAYTHNDVLVSIHDVLPVLARTSSRSRPGPTGKRPR